MWGRKCNEWEKRNTWGRTHSSVQRAKRAIHNGRRGASGQTITADRDALQRERAAVEERRFSAA